MTFSISDFRKSLKGGSRANQFNISFGALPTGVALPNATILCKAAAVPGFTIGQIAVPFRGRTVKVPGDRTFAEWTATFIVDPAMSIRIGFETWMNYIKALDFTTTTLRTGSGIDYDTTITVDHLKDDNSVSRTYKLGSAFPTDVSQIDVSYDSADAVEEFTVTFQYLDLIDS
jgi:hypothetical protein